VDLNFDDVEGGGETRLAARSTVTGGDGANKKGEWSNTSEKKTLRYKRAKGEENQNGLGKDPA